MPPDTRTTAPRPAGERPRRGRHSYPRTRAISPVDLRPLLHPDPRTPPFPSYQEEPEIVRAWVWPIAQVAALATAVAVIVMLFLHPRQGLVLWWLWLLPTLPMIWMLAPGLWRNVCPMAMLNQLPRRFGISLDRRVPTWLARHSYLVQMAFYFSAISARAPFLDRNGPALGILMIIALVAALVGGLLFTGKSGWCGTFCPLLPVQKLYGQTPAVVVKNSHCPTCVGCIKNCYDVNPRLATIADLRDDDQHWVAQRKLFAGLFPGFIVAFFTINTAPVGQPLPVGFDVARFYGLTGLAMLISLGCFYLVEALLPTISPTLLTAVFGALGLNLHNVLRFTTTWGVAKPPVVLWVENVLVLAVTVWFVVRTWRQERRADDAAARGLVMLPMPRRRVPEPSAAGPAPGPAAGTTAGTAAMHRVTVDDRPTVTVAAGQPLLEAVEAAGAAVRPGCRAGLCGADPVQVTGPPGCVSEPGDTERATLARLGLDAPGVRLACAARVLGEIRVCTSLPAEGAERPAEPQDPPSRRVVVVGNGVAGTTVAQRLRAKDDRLDVTLVSTEIRPFYNRMAIGSLITGADGPDTLHLPTGWTASGRVSTLLNTHAVAIDRHAAQVRLATGQTLDYDRLVLATGSEPLLPGIPGIRLPGVFTLRTAEDATGIRAYLQQHGCRRAVVLGAGLLGLEAAALLQRYGIRTTVVDGADRPMVRHLDAPAGAVLTRHLQAQGIAVVLDVWAAAVLGDERVEAVRLGDDAVLPADLVVVCIGTGPRVGLARDAGLEVGRGVVVDSAMRTSDPQIFAVGDVAEHRGEVHGLWAPAADHAELAAACIVGEPVSPRPPSSYAAVLKDVGLDVMSVGRITPRDGDEVLADEDAAGYRYRTLLLQRGVPVGGIVIGDPARAAQLQSLVQAGERVTPDQLADWRHATPRTPATDPGALSTMRAA